MLVAWLAMVVLLVGLVVYVIATNPKAAELGRLAFFVGLFFVVWALARYTVKLP